MSQAIDFSIDRSALKRALVEADKGSDRKSSIDIISHALLRAEPGKGVRLHATDLHNHVVIAVQGATLKSGSAVACPAYKMLKATQRLPDEPVRIYSNGNNEVQLSARKGAIAFTLPGMPAADFPALPATDESTLMANCDADELLAAIEAVRTSISDDWTRPHLAALKLEADGGALRLIATDGHRLSTSEVKRTGTREALESLIDSRAATLLSDIIARSDAATLDRVTVSKHPQGFTSFDVGPVRLICKDVSEQFPPWRKVVPKTEPFTIATLDASSLREALQRASLTTKGSVRFTVAPGAKHIELACEDPEVGSFCERVKAKLTKVSEPRTIGLSPAYIKSAIEYLDADEVNIAIREPLDPVVITRKGESKTFKVVMPVRI